jgi:hypothetical protein
MIDSIPLDVWQKAIEDAMRARPNQEDEGVTVQELCSMFDMSQTKIRTYLRELIRIGRVYPKHGRRPSLDGILRGIPVYILKSKED